MQNNRTAKIMSIFSTVLIIVGLELEVWPSIMFLVSLA